MFDPEPGRDRASESVVLPVVGSTSPKSANKFLEDSTVWKDSSSFMSDSLTMRRTVHEYLLDFPDQDPAQPRYLNGAQTQRPDSDLYTSRYQRERQRAYDRAAHMADSPSYGHEVEDAKAEAALGAKPRSAGSGAINSDGPGT